MVLRCWQEKQNQISKLVQQSMTQLYQSVMYNKIRSIDNRHHQSITALFPQASPSLANDRHHQLIRLLHPQQLRSPINHNTFFSLPRCHTRIHLNGLQAAGVHALTFSTSEIFQALLLLKYQTGFAEERMLKEEWFESMLHMQFKCKVFNTTKNYFLHKNKNLPPFPTLDNGDWDWYLGLLNIRSTRTHFSLTSSLTKEKEATMKNMA